MILAHFEIVYVKCYVVDVASNAPRETESQGKTRYSDSILFVVIMVSLGSLWKTNTGY